MIRVLLEHGHTLYREGDLQVARAVVRLDEVPAAAARDRPRVRPVDGAGSTYASWPGPSPGEELVTGVRCLARGEPVLDIELVVAALTAQANPLTERECELVMTGATTQEVARRLG